MQKSILFTYLSIFAHLLLQARHYCQTNATVPVLQRFFQGEDTRPDFRLSRQAIQVLLGVLQTERQHGWGPTMETLVFLFWIATGAAYRVVSRAFGIPMSSVHRMVHSIAEVVAVRAVSSSCHQMMRRSRPWGKGLPCWQGTLLSPKQLGPKTGPTPLNQTLKEREETVKPLP